MKNKVKIYVDLDGTVCDSSRRLKSIKAPKNKTHYSAEYLHWLDLVQKEHDMLNDKVIKSMRTLARKLGKFVYLTSRDEKYRAITVKWLTKHKFPKRKLIMRSSNDKTSYGYFKQKEIKKYQKKGDQVILVDDDPRGQLAGICAKNNWILLKVISGLNLP